MIQSLKYDNPQFQVEVDWDITQRCNYSCSYCASYDNDQPFYFKSLEEYIESFKYLSEYFGNKTIKLNFLGGEPTLFKQWVRLVNWLADYNYKPIVTTNLSVPCIQYVRVLNPRLENFIIASYHGEFAKLEQFYNNCKMLSANNNLKCIILLADPKNWDYTMYCYKKLSEVGLVNLKPIKQEFTSSYSISSGWVDYTEEQLKEFEKNPTVDECFTLCTGDNTLHPSLYEIRNKYSNFKGMKCAVGKNRLHVKPNGDVYPSACLLNYPRAKMGNIYEKNLIKAKSAVTCPFNECLCGPDIRIEKWAQV